MEFILNWVIIFFFFFLVLDAILCWMVYKMKWNLWRKYVICVSVCARNICIVAESWQKTKFVIFETHTKKRREHKKIYVGGAGKMNPLDIGYKMKYSIFTFSLDLRCVPAQHILLLPHKAWQIYERSRVKQRQKQQPNGMKNMCKMQSFMLCPFIISRLFARQMRANVH